MAQRFTDTADVTPRRAVGCHKAVTDSGYLIFKLAYMVIRDNTEEAEEEIVALEMHIQNHDLWFENQNGFEAVIRMPLLLPELRYPSPVNFKECIT